MKADLKTKYKSILFYCSEVEQHDTLQFGKWNKILFGKIKYLFKLVGGKKLVRSEILEEIQFKYVNKCL